MPVAPNSPRKSVPSPTVLADYLPQQLTPIEICRDRRRRHRLDRCRRARHEGHGQGDGAGHAADQGQGRRPALVAAEVRRQLSG